MKLGLINSAWAQAGRETAFGIRMTKEIGFDSIDIFADPLDIDVRERKRIKNECDRAGLPIISLACVAVGLVDFNPSVQRFHVGRVKAYLDGHPAEDPVVNPLSADLSGLPPMLVQAATGDMILPDAQRLVERALEHGVDAKLELYPADTHVFHVFWSFLPEAADALQRAGAFTRSSLAGHSPALEQPG